MPDCHGCSRKAVRGVEDVDVSETRVSAFKELTVDEDTDSKHQKV